MGRADNHYAGYAWTITRDFLAEEHNEPRNETGTSGPSNLGVSPKLSHPILAQLFRMYDDDNVLYYEGIIAGEYTGFEPLMDFGTPNAGATRIDYYCPAYDEWRTL